MSWVIVDIEADGPIPGDYSMVSFAAIVLKEGCEIEDLPVFYGTLCPISHNYIPEKLAIAGHSREETLKFLPAEIVMKHFEKWLDKHSIGNPAFISDNNGFDYMFISWYFYHFLKRNPFGHSSTNLGSLYKGLVGTMKKNFKKLRKTKHTHNPVDDVEGNAEALIYMINEMNLKMELK